MSGFPQAPSGAYVATGVTTVQEMAGPLATQLFDLGGEVINVAHPAYGALCDGGVSQSGALNTSTAVVSDSTPSPTPVQEGHTFTWVGTGSAVGGGVTGVTQTAGFDTVTIQTSSAHGLSSGQIVTIAGIGGALDINGTWGITVIASNKFTIPYSCYALIGAYTSGGTVTPWVNLFGYVENPVTTGGTLTFTAVTTEGGSTPITIPAGTASAGTYYFGTDDTAAWLSAIAVAETLANTYGVKSVEITWAGTSMVSQMLNPDGNVKIRGLWMDYTNPDGTLSSSTMPQRGSILRPTGALSNPTTSAVLCLGTTTGNAGNVSGKTGTSISGGCIDGANIAQSALRTAGNRNWALETYALNGSSNAIDLEGSNSQIIECVAGQSNLGDCIYVAGSGDMKIKGGYARQGHYMIRSSAAASGDLYIGGGIHLFNGYSGGNETYGADILIESGGIALHIDGVILDGVLGPQIRIAPASGHTLTASLITGVTSFQPTTSGIPNNQWPVIQIDTSASSSVVATLLFADYVCDGAGSSNRYKSIMDCVGSGTQTKIILGEGVATNCSQFYTNTTAPAPIVSGEIATFNGTATVNSRFKGQLTCTGDGSTTVFMIAHGMGVAPATGTVQATLAATSSPVGFPTTLPGPIWTADATNIYATFVAAPTSGSWTFNVSARVG